jgi:hypothetical protein
MQYSASFTRGPRPSRGARGRARPLPQQMSLSISGVECVLVYVREDFVPPGVPLEMRVS